MYISDQQRSTLQHNNCIQYFVIICKGKEPKKRDTYVCITESLFRIPEITQHYKSTIF